MRTSSEVPVIREVPADQKVPFIYGELVFQGRLPALHQVQDEEHCTRNDEGGK